ncbi:PREDICTED: fetuin-B-like isoform X2 [Condylura cristata]|uniref:fetuin-B-like isoform X2 n=1 Tax=Condylura cristata TaxID=143302 RepID=UPI0006438898|nr:PREDICTED: fetuin-B-like isoform X2 [Condylura cristata]
MGLLLPLVLCALAVVTGATSPPGPDLPPIKPSPLLSRGCNDSDVLSFAGVALEHINRDRKDGYVLRLNRVSDAREHRQVYGQCKALLYMPQTTRILNTRAYNCTLRPVSSRKIHSMCPDCPTLRPIDVSNPEVLEAATESLAKYNNESTSKQYSLVKVTRASAQWVYGFSYSVEYLIKEEPCTKSEASCTLQSPNSEPVGLCIGSLSRKLRKTFVSVTCDFFESQAPAPGGENSAVNLPKVEESQDKKAAPTDASSTAVPKGFVQYLSDPETQEGDPVEDFPVHLDLTTNHQRENLGTSFPFMGPVRETLPVLPFPSKEHRSSECPGPAEDPNPLLLPP